MNENDLYTILQRDDNLREAIRRREQKQPTMPADLNDRLMKRLEAALSLPPRGEERTKSLPYWGRLVGTVACLLIIVGIGVTLMHREESHNVVKPRQTVVVKKETKTDAPQPETKVTETPKAVAVAESKTIRKPKKKAAPMQVAFQEQEGLFQIRAVCPINEHDKDVLKTILTQLKTVAEEFPKNVQIVEKGN